MSSWNDGSGAAWILNGLSPEHVGVAEAARTHFVGYQSGDYAEFVQSVGDLDQDGFDDVAVGAYGLGGDDVGKLVLFYGPLPTGTFPVDQCAGAVLEGFSGSAPVVATAAGDLQGDGIPDLAVGDINGSTIYFLGAGTL